MVEFKTVPMSSVKVKVNQSKSSQKSSQNSSQKILGLISANPAITTLELADIIGMSRRAVAKHIAVLQASGVLRRVGPDKGGHWEVLKDWN